MLEQAQSIQATSAVIFITVWVFIIVMVQSGADEYAPTTVKGTLLLVILISVLSFVTSTLIRIWA